MFVLFTIITFVSWAFVSIFYKITGKVDENTHLKTGILVGLIMGIHATIYMIYKGMNLDFIDMLKYLPISIFDGIIFYHLSIFPVIRQNRS